MIIVGGYSMAKASTVIKVARQYKDYQEKRLIGTREQMWNFHWCAGSANYTIWAILYAEYTQRNFQGQPWCAIYGSVMFVLAYGLEEAKKLLGGDLPFNCQDFVNKHKRDSRLNKIPSIGSPVIYWTGNKYGHWGICTSVDADGNGFTAVEGNTSGGADKVDSDGGAVVEKWHSLAITTLFWHPDFELDEAQEPEPVLYAIDCGQNGLTVTMNLNIRDTPDGKNILNIYRKNEHVFPTKKQFINGKAWYHTDRGWISSRCLEGWVLENNGRWWYLMSGYDFSVNNWQDIAGERYYFDNTGYMVTSSWIEYNGKNYYVTAAGTMAKGIYIKSLDKELYYWVNETGIWEPQWDTVTPNLDCYSLIK